jgi:Thioesterase superfamily
VQATPTQDIIKARSGLGRNCMARVHGAHAPHIGNPRDFLSSYGWSGNTPQSAPAATPTRTPPEPASRATAVTAAMDEIAFLRAVQIGDVVHVHADVTWAGRSSMEVAVKVSADRWDRAVHATTVAAAQLVMVAAAPAKVEERRVHGRDRPGVKKASTSSPLRMGCRMLTAWTSA